MTRLVPLRRLLLVTSGLLVVLTIALGVAARRSEEPVLIILPAWTGHLPTLALALFLTAQAIAAARGGLRRACLVVLPVTLITALALGAVLAVATAVGGRVEVDRVTLPGDRTVVLTVEPLIEETVLDLWEARGRRWRTLLGTGGVSYSGSEPLAGDPRLTLTGSGQYLLIRWGGLWIDCRTTEASSSPCLVDDHDWPTSLNGWRERSARIAGAIGVDPS